MTRPAPSAEPTVRFVVGSEPGDRAELVTALARLLVDVVDRRRETAGQGPPMKTPPAPAGAAGKKGCT